MPTMQTSETGVASRVLSGLWRGAVLVVGLPALVTAFSQPPAIGQASDGVAPPAEAETRRALPDATRSKEAAEVATRLRARFRETLDFAPLMDDFMVSDVARRSLATEIFDDWRMKDGLLESLPDDEIAQGYVAYMNLAHMITAYISRSAREGADHIPPQVAEEMAATRYFRSLIGEEGHTPRIETRDDFLEWVGECERAGAAYRTAMEPEPRGLTDECEVFTNESDEDTGYLKLGVPAGQPVYEVQFFDFCYSIVDDHGTLRVVAIELVHA